MAKAQKNEDPIVAKAFDASKHEELVNLFQQLPPDAAAYYIVKLEATLKKRKLQLTGYLVALVVWLGGMVLALAYFGATEGFTGWVFLLPFAAVGGILYLFGRWAEMVGNAIGDPPASVPTAQAKPADGKIKESRSRISK